MNSVRTLTKKYKTKMEIENIKRKQSEMKNSITERMNTLERINSILNEVEDQLSNLEDIVAENTQTAMKIKKIKKNN